MKKKGGGAFGQCFLEIYDYFLWAFESSVFAVLSPLKEVDETVFVFRPEEPFKKGKKVQVQMFFVYWNLNFERKKKRLGELLCQALLSHCPFLNHPLNIVRLCLLQVLKISFFLITFFFFLISWGSATLKQ